MALYVGLLRKRKTEWWLLVVVTVVVVEPAAYVGVMVVEGKGRTLDSQPAVDFDGCANPARPSKFGRTWLLRSYQFALDFQLPLHRQCHSGEPPSNKKGIGYGIHRHV